MNTIIRKATEEDLEKIQNLTKKLNKKQNEEYDKTINPNFAVSSGGEKYLQKILQGGGVIFLAEDENVPVGFIVAALELVGDFRLINNYCEIDFLWVDEDYRNQGVGRLLIKYVEDWCVNKGVRKMRVVVDISNTEARRLYKEKLFEEYELTLEKDI